MTSVGVITIISGNGGSGCSTTAVNLAYWMTQQWGDHGRFLLAEFDEQGDSSHLLDVPSSSNAMKYLTQPTSRLENLVQPSPIERLDVLSSNRSIAAAESMLSQLVNQAEDKTEFRESYAEHLHDMILSYRGVVIDPAKTGEIRIAAIMASDKLIMTTRMANHNQKNTLALVGLADKLMQEGASIHILPIALEVAQAKADEESIAILRQEAQKLAPERHVTVSSGIPKSVAVTDAANAGQPLLQYAPHDSETYRGKRKASASKAYHEFFLKTIGV